MTMQPHEYYMRRAIEIARCGIPYAHPNPLVGAVITGPDGEILAEGFHRCCGEAHAEVNAVAMLDANCPGIDCHPLTIYVSLEPCAHYGRTPPCALLLKERGFGRVVIGTLDPFSKVDGKGAQMLREAGAEVVVGVLEKECRELNRPFFIAHTHGRPYIMLKWAQSADGYIDAVRTPEHPGPYSFSTGITRTLVHKLRTEFGAIAVGAGTVRADNPRLDSRLWPGPSPRPVVFGSEACAEGSPLAGRSPIFIPDARNPEDLRRAMHILYKEGITSLLVEGGARLLSSFIQADLWDDIRIETSPVNLGSLGSVPSPEVPGSAGSFSVGLTTIRHTPTPSRQGIHY